MMMKNKKILLAIFIIVIFAMSLLYYRNTQIQTSDVLVGMGSEAKNGDTVVFDYRGFLYNPDRPKGFGEQFDSSYSRQTPMTARIGEKQLIAGLDEALVSMKVGGQRIAIIPSTKGYGQFGAAAGLVPPNTKLIYLIELRSKKE